VRPERISLGPLGRYEAILLDDVDLGSVRELTVALGDTLELTVRTSETLELTIGSPLPIEIEPEDVTMWPLPSSRHEDDGSTTGVSLPGTA
jgi:hypothetical protein